MSGFSEPNEIVFEEITTLTDAIARMVDGSGIPRKVLADRLGIEFRHFNRMLNRHDSRHFPPNLIDQLMVECKSLLPLEWQAWKRGQALHDRSLRSILEAIRDAMTADGKAPRFVIHRSGRVECVQREADG